MGKGVASARRVDPRALLGEWYGADRANMVPVPLPVQVLARRLSVTQPVVRRGGDMECQSLAELSIIARSMSTCMPAFGRLS